MPKKCRLREAAGTLILFRLVNDLQRELQDARFEGAGDLPAARLPPVIAESGGVAPVEQGRGGGALRPLMLPGR